MSAQFPLFCRARVCTKCGCDKPAAFEYCLGFSGRSDTKCGQIVAAIEGKQQEEQRYGGFATSHLTVYGSSGTAYVEEHIHRTCIECGYVWIERTLDKGHPLEQLGAQAQ